MDVAAYRQFNKPGWVLSNHESTYWDSLESQMKYVSNLEQAQAYGDFNEASRTAIALQKFTNHTWKVIPIPDLPKEDKSEKIKEELRRVVESIGQFDSTTLAYLGIANELYDLISRIVDEKLEKR